MARSIRALRVIRLFGRVKSLRRPKNDYEHRLNDDDDDDDDDDDTMITFNFNFSNKVSTNMSSAHPSPWLR